MNASDTAQAIAYHEALASAWSRRYDKSSFRSRASAVSELLAGIDVRGKNWLDVGCGTGNLSVLLANHGANVYGVDGSPNMICAARELSAGKSNIAFMEIDDIEQWEWSGKQLDGLLCSSVLEYLNFPDAMLHRFAAWMRPGGTLLVSLPNKRSLLRRVQRIMFATTKRVTGNPRPAYLKFSKHEFGREWATEMIEAGGFQVVLTRPFGMPVATSIFDSALTSPLFWFLAKKLG